MGGICGRTLDHDGKAVAAMNATLHHRGPGDHGVHVDPDSGFALGATASSVFGGRADQPQANEPGDVWAVLDGEIYNQPFLQRHLRERGHRFGAESSAEVLVHLYEEYGDELVHALEGMFSFALWDARRCRLLLGRDRFGEKPLFYAQRAGVLCFASELNALCAGGDVEAELDEVALDAFFAFGYIPGPGSIFKAARQLPPGHLLTWEHEAGRAVVRPYWSLPSYGQSPAEPKGELVAETQRLLEASVRSRITPDVPVAILLSGGVGSTLVAALAAAHCSAPIRTFTVGYDGCADGRAQAAAAVAQAVGADHHELLVSSDDLLSGAPALLAALDQPLADQALPGLHAVWELARQDVATVIGGDGADEIFGGHARYRRLAVAARVQRYVPPALGARSARTLGGRSRRLGHVLDVRSTLEQHLDWVTERRPALRTWLYGPRLADVARRSHADVLRGGVEGRLAMSVPGGLMHLDQALWLPDGLLARSDRAGMLASLEIRTPYLHRELAEFCATVSPEVHLGGGGNALLRSVLSALLPAHAPRRRATAWRSPAAQWLRGPLAPAIAHQLQAGRLYAEGWMNVNAARRLAVEHAGGRRDHSHVLWPLLALGLWLDRLRGSDGI